jgi:predicted RNase H-like HicB family nuclease
MRFFIRIYHDGHSYSALAPDLPGCVAAGDTVEETKQLMADAIVMHLDLLTGSGEKIPSPRHSMKFTMDETSEEEFCTWVDVRLPKRVARKATAR